jgi:hypothetical protein
MAQFPVLVAGHSQAGYFDQFLKLPNINVVFFPGRKIELTSGSPIKVLQT